jgi:hypothetical protein
MASVVYPRSTQVLQPHSNWHLIPEELLAAAALRGTVVHDLCAAQAKGLFLPKIPKEYAGYVESHRKWLKNAVERVIFVEREFICSCYFYVGHPDCGVVIRGDRGITVPDLKTPAVQNRAWRAQAASYWHLVSEHGDFELPVIRSGSLMLDSEGGIARLVEYTEFNAYDFNGFINALNSWRWFNEL